MIVFRMCDDVDDDDDEDDVCGNQTCKHTGHYSRSRPVACAVHPPVLRSAASGAHIICTPCRPPVVNATLAFTASGSMDACARRRAAPLDHLLQVGVPARLFLGAAAVLRLCAPRRRATTVAPLAPLLGRPFLLRGGEISENKILH